MNQPFFMLEVDPEMPASDRDSLVATMNNSVKVQQESTRQMLPD